ncbi:extracellular solute-binding protein [Micromonospora sp. NPDC049301]|uniref:extracellular solute-binding protein n=1 Tax=Micromonospora sp. NPDC049301 TaxID=3155723 RepID=UPI003424C1CC
MIVHDSKENRSGTITASQDSDHDLGDVPASVEADMKRFVRSWAAVAVAGLTLTGCGFGADDGQSEGGSTLSFLVPSYSDGTKALWEGIIADFEAAHSDINVELEIQSWDNINDVVRTKVQSNAAPDILNIDAFSGFAADDLLYSADEVVSANTAADFQQSFADNASIDGTMYGLPLIASARTMFYNTELFERAGVAAPPKTWDQLLDAAKKVAGLGNGVYGYGMPLGSEEAQAETSIWTFGNGGSWTNGSTIAVNTPANLEAVTFMKRMIDEKATQPDPGASDRTPMLDVFIQGKIGMVVALPPTVGQIAEKNPSLKYASAPIPTKDGQPMTLGVADHLMAFKNKGDKQEAVKTFLDYVFSAPVYTTFVDTEGFLPTTKSGAAALAGKTKIASFLEVLPNARFYPSTNPQWATTQGAMQSLMGQIGQGKEPGTVLDEIQAKANG